MQLVVVAVAFTGTPRACINSEHKCCTNSKNQETGVLYSCTQLKGMEYSDNENKNASTRLVDHHEKCRISPGGRQQAPTTRN